MNKVVPHKPLAKFVSGVLSHLISTNNLQPTPQVLLEQRNQLKGLEAFIGVSPLYWINLRIQAHHRAIPQSLVLKKFNRLGYRCDEWIGTDNSAGQLGIFSAAKRNKPKMIFCSESNGANRIYDVLIPVLASHAGSAHL